MTVQLSYDDDEEAPVIEEIAELRQRANHNAAEIAYQESLLRRPCGFHQGPAGQPCARPTCGASWAAHYGERPQDKEKKATVQRAAQKGR
jgi:hypothetical protein